MSWSEGMGAHLPYRSSFKGPSSSGYIYDTGESSSIPYSHSEIPLLPLPIPPDSIPRHRLRYGYQDISPSDPKDESPALLTTKTTWYMHSSSPQYRRLPHPIAFSNLYANLKTIQTSLQLFSTSFASETSSIRSYTPRTLLSALWRFRVATQAEAHVAKSGDWYKKYMARKWWKDLFDRSLSLSYFGGRYDSDEEIERRGSGGESFKDEDGQVSLWQAAEDVSWAFACAACALPGTTETDEGDGGEGSAPVVKGELRPVPTYDEWKKQKAERDELRTEVCRKLTDEWASFNLDLWATMHADDAVWGLQQTIENVLKTLEYAEGLWMREYKSGKWKDAIKEVATKGKNNPASAKGKEKEVHWA